MNEVHRINIQLKLAHQGGAWHGPSLQELLQGVTAAQAAQHPVEEAHSIWELVNHIAAWEAIVTQRLRGVMLDARREYLEPYMTPARANQFIADLLGSVLNQLVPQVLAGLG